MTIIDALKSDKDVRVSCGHRWLVVRVVPHGLEYIVYEARRRGAMGKEIISTDDEGEAVRFLCE